MIERLPYCGLPPVPGELLWRFNLDPLLILALVAIASVHYAASKPERRRYTGLGWLVAAVAFLSPLCALSVSLFSARIAQHMALLLVAAPLLAFALPISSALRSQWGLWTSVTAFFAAIWFWHMPVPYDATFSSSAVYWTMHITLFGSAILLWRELLHHRPERTIEVLIAGGLTSMQMSLLGAVLALATRPLYLSHLTSTVAWGMSPLQDQTLGGTLMWVPGILLFLWAALRSLERLRNALDSAKHA